MNKLVDLGIIAMRNEEEDVRGWAKESLFFCKKVVAIVDPESTDRTEEILKTEFPEIIVEYQDRSLGDSDDDHIGPEKNMICHANFTKGIYKHAKVGDWIMEMAPDERLDPAEFELILKDLHYAQNHGYDGLVFPNYHTPIENFQTEIDWYSVFEWGGLLQVKFWKLHKGYYKNKPPHSNQKNFCRKLYDTAAGFYHFCYVKKTRIPFAGWRDQQEYKNIKRKAYTVPFTDWQNMPELTNQGKIK